LDKPVPGIAMDARTPDLPPLRVKLNGPSLIVLDADCGPLSVTLTPKIVLSKLKADRFLLGMVLRCVEF
jgi:hypothetical protein